MVAVKITCLDKSCCLGYNCIDTWYGNQQETWVEKNCYLSKKSYLIHLLPQLAWLLLKWLVYMSYYLGYNRVDTYDDKQEESFHEKYSVLSENHIWYIFVLIRIVDSKMTRVDKSFFHSYNRFDTWVGIKQET